MRKQENITDGLRGDAFGFFIRIESCSSQVLATFSSLSSSFSSLLSSSLSLLLLCCHKESLLSSPPPCWVSWCPSLLARGRREDGEEQSPDRGWLWVHREEVGEGKLGARPPHLRSAKAGDWIGLDIENIEILLDFKQQGARLVEASFSDHPSLVEAVKLVDVVVCAVSGVHHRGHSILMQLKLVDAIKEAGNIKRFVPSEFGMDPAHMASVVLPNFRKTIEDKMVVRKAIVDAGIPHTYVSANCSAGYFVGSLCQGKALVPPRDRVYLHGDGGIKAVFVAEDDVGTYTIKAVDDPQTLNKTLYLRPPQNIMSQIELVKIWENLIGKRLEKISISEEEYLASKKTADEKVQATIDLYYHIFHEGRLTNFEIGEDEEEASNLYPEVVYTRVEDYLKRYL